MSYNEEKLLNEFDGILDIEASDFIFDPEYEVDVLRWLSKNWDNGTEIRIGLSNKVPMNVKDGEYAGQFVIVEMHPGDNWFNNSIVNMLKESPMNNYMILEDEYKYVLRVQMLTHSVSIIPISWNINSAIVLDIHQETFN